MVLYKIGQRSSLVFLIIYRDKIYRRVFSMNIPRPIEKGGISRVGAPGTMTNKQVESCFLNHNSSIHFCCSDSLLMTHRGELRLSIIIWRIGRGPSFLLPWGPKILLAALYIPACTSQAIISIVMYGYRMMNNSS